MGSSLSVRVLVRNLLIAATERLFKESAEISNPLVMSLYYIIELRH